jgi:prevent-host-death family protein
MILKTPPAQAGGVFSQRAVVCKYEDFSVQSVLFKVEVTMSENSHYGLEQARAQLPLIASEAVAGYTSVITRHGKPVAVVVPVGEWQSQQQMRQAETGSILALRGTGKGLWPQGAGQAVADLRDEWQD